MKNVKKVLCLIVIMSILLSATACSRVKETVSSSKAAASDMTVESVISDATQKATKINSFDSVNIDVVFSVEQSADKAIKGNCKVDAFIKDMKAQAATTFTKDGAETKNNIYLDQTNVIFSLDGEKYSKLDLTKIASISPELNTILNIVKSLNSNMPKSDSNNTNETKFKAEASKDSGSADNNETSDAMSGDGIDIKSLLDKFLSVGNLLTLDGTKTVCGHKMYVLKAAISNQQINSMVDTYKDFVNIPDDVSDKIRATDGINAEVYISASDENVVGFRADLSGILATSTGDKPSDNNYMQMVFGINSSKDFQIPEAGNLSIKDMKTLITEIPKILDKLSPDTKKVPSNSNDSTKLNPNKADTTEQNSNSADATKLDQNPVDTTKLTANGNDLSQNDKVYKEFDISSILENFDISSILENFDINSIFENFDINSILEKIDIKQIIFDIIKSLILG